MLHVFAWVYPTVLIQLCHHGKANNNTMTSSLWNYDYGTTTALLKYAFHLWYGNRLGILKNFLFWGKKFKQTKCICLLGYIQHYSSA